MLHKNLKKTDPKLYCEKCDYLAKRKGDFKKHLESKKHKTNECYTNATQKFSHFCPCGKKYKHHSSFFRHKNKCVYQAEINETSMGTGNMGTGNMGTGNMGTGYVVSMLKDVMNENKKLQEQMLQMQSAHTSVLHSIIPKIGSNNSTNSNNKVINVQMFLNEKCQDAMTIQNFAKQLMVTMDELNKSKKDCITNVVLKNLRPLSITERPFHCANVNMKEWYIKDEKEGWEEDNGEKLIKNAEDGIQKQWLKEFESLYPNWMSNESLQDKYVKIAGSTTCELPEKMKLKLLRELGRNVPLSTKDIE